MNRPTAWVVVALLVLYAFELPVAQDTDAQRSDDVASAARTDLWDEDDEFVGLPAASQQAPINDASAKKPKPRKVVKSFSKRARQTAWNKQDHYFFEILGVAGILVYVVNYFVGRRVNQRLAVAFCQQFALDGQLLHRNFSLIGTGDRVAGMPLLKESQSRFKLYLSGRRFCRSAEVTLECKARQDLLWDAWYLVNPTEDLLFIDVQLQEHHCPLTVLAVGQPKLLRGFAANHKDLKAFSKPLAVASDKLPSWPKSTAVYCEHPSVFYDLFSDARAQSAVVEPEEEFFSCFRYMKLTSDDPDDQHKHLLRVCLSVPGVQSLEQLLAPLGWVMYMIDLVGSYKQSPEIRKRAQESRAREAEEQFKQSSESRIERAQQKKLERLQAEKERVARMGPEARAKWEERQARKLKQAKKQRVVMG